ncbi:hypothetical protein CCHR01_12112 [Colletotrichum chrysophilum]|uniref:Uncharacterized protein n=1 Tax=Colletotrichum chrysophilum TaxID=1836956 RepID=A0AAD9AEQ2_9PEZI|nr:hypothetical protein CCHR01_12112 [Colletotrichum chrysophilum]
MRQPTNHEPVEPAEIRRAILDEMLKRHDANQEQPPNPTIPDVKATVLDTTAANLSQAVPSAQNESSNETIVELTASLARNIDDVARDRIRGQIQAILKDEDDQDEHLREQLEMLSRFTVRGPAEVDGPLGVVMKPFLDSMVNFAAGVLGVARNGNVLAYLEKRKRLREEHGYQASGAKGADEGLESQRAEDENEYYD